MRRMSLSPRLRNWAGVLAWAAIFVVAQQLTFLLLPWVPVWLWLAIGCLMIAYSITLTVKRMRRPLLEPDVGDEHWTDTPLFLCLGLVALLPYFLSE